MANTQPPADDALSDRRKHGHNARRARAKLRDAVRAERSPVEQIRILDAKFGTGKGAKRERTRLAALLQQR